MAQVKKATAVVDGTNLVITFAHGEELTLSAADLPQAMQQACLMHGIKQKVCDSYSGSATPADALEKAEAVIKALLDSNWTTRVAGEGGARVTQLAQALANVTGKTLEEAVEVIDGLTAEKKKALSANPQIKVAVARIQALKAQEAAEKAEAEAEGASVEDILSASSEDEAA